MNNEPTPAELRFGSGWKLLIPFAVLPLAIVSVAVGIFLLFGKLADNRLGPEDYLRRMKTTSSHKRWQAAYELSRFLAKGDAGKNAAEFQSEMISLLRSSKSDETEFRKYLMIGLGQIGNAEAAPALMDMAKNESDSEVKIYAIWALGRVGAREAAPFVRSQLNSEDAGIRKAAAFALGFTGTKEDVKLLSKLLEDPIQDVRWNAALAMAQLGSDAGKREILFLLDSEKLKSATPNLRDSERIQIQISAANAAAKSGLAEAKIPLEKLKKTQSDSILLATVGNSLESLK